MGRKWCLDCGQYVNAEKKSRAVPFFVVWGAILVVEALLFITAANNRASGAMPLFWIFLITLGSPILLYPLLSSGKERCPICKGTNFTETNPKTDTVENSS
jgi:uncharacterized membrane protein YhaH (DUF805 family)